MNLQNSTHRVDIAVPQQFVLFNTDARIRFRSHLWFHALLYYFVGPLFIPAYTPGFNQEVHVTSCNVELVEDLPDDTPNACVVIPSPKLQPSIACPSYNL